MQVASRLRTVWVQQRLAAAARAEAAHYGQTVVKIRWGKGDGGTEWKRSFALIIQI